MRHAGVPTAHFEAFDRQETALAYLRDELRVPHRRKGRRCAAGKGVTIALIAETRPRRP